MWLSPAQWGCLTGQGAPRSGRSPGNQAWPQLPCLPATPAGTRMGASQLPRTGQTVGLAPSLRPARGVRRMWLDAALPLQSPRCLVRGLPQNRGQLWSAARLVSSGPVGRLAASTAPHSAASRPTGTPAALSGVIFRSKASPRGPMHGDAGRRAPTSRPSAQAGIPCSEVWRAQTPGFGDKTA